MPDMPLPMSHSCANHHTPPLSIIMFHPLPHPYVNHRDLSPCTTHMSILSCPLSIIHVIMPYPHVHNHAPSLFPSSCPSSCPPPQPHPNSFFFGSFSSPVSCFTLHLIYCCFHFVFLYLSLIVCFYFRFLNLCFPSPPGSPDHSHISPIMFISCQGSTLAASITSRHVHPLNPASPGISAMDS